ncbi:MAG TPA: hypothetical protein V6C81_08580 [Planktothrix sp.]
MSMIEFCNINVGTSATDILTDKDDRKARQVRPAKKETVCAPTKQNRPPTGSGLFVLTDRAIA